MSYIVRWTDNAMDGLIRVHAFLAEKDIDVAQRAMDAIEAGADILTYFPYAGRLKDGFDTENRELLISFGASGYVLFYEVAGDDVLILAVKHQKEAEYGPY